MEFEPEWSGWRKLRALSYSRDRICKIDGLFIFGNVMCQITPESVGSTWWLLIGTIGEKAATLAVPQIKGRGREAIRSLATIELIKIETIGGINREGICPTRYGPRTNLDNRSEKVAVASP